MFSSFFMPALGFLRQGPDQAEAAPGDDSVKAGRQSGCHSRSTSPGSSLSPGSSSLDRSSKNATPHRKGASSLPDYDYPVPLIVQNTFITTRDGSLDGYYRDREINSCPASGICAPPGLDGLEAVAEAEAVDIDAAATAASAAARSTPSATPASGVEEECQLKAPPRWPSTMSHDDLEAFVGLLGEAGPTGQAPAGPALLAGITPVAPCVVGAPLPPPPPPQWAPVLKEAELPPAPPAPQPLKLSEALPEPELGSPELPTIGSAGHKNGTCKPCAFQHTKGCSNGTACPFCHLCDAGEKKRRQKERKELQKEATRWEEFKASWGFENAVAPAPR